MGPQYALAAFMQARQAGGPQGRGVGPPLSLSGDVLRDVGGVIQVLCTLYSILYISRKLNLIIVALP